MKTPKLTVQRLAAIAVILGLLMVVENFFSIRFSQTLQFQFTFLPNLLLGSVAGPIFGPLAAAVSDPIFAVMSGQTVLPLFIVIEAVKAFIYGVAFYQKPLDLQKKQDWFYVVGVTLVISAVISFVMTPIVLHHYYQTPWEVLYASRVMKAVIEIPLQVLVTMLIVPQLQRIPELRRLMGLKK